MRDFGQDLRFAFRQFRKSPGFAITAVLSLMLGIGATTAIFSVIYGVLLDPYPYKDADRMIHVELRDKNGRGPLLRVTGPEYLELRNSPSIDDVFLQQYRQQNLTGDQIPVSVDVGLYSPNLFEYMGVPPLLGREFAREDVDRGDAEPVAVLSYLFWQRQYGANRDIVGKSIELNHKLYTVIGVVPPRFTWGDSDVYIPMKPTADATEYWMSFVKLKPGAGQAVATAELQVLADNFAKRDPKNYPQERRATIVSLNEEVLGKFAGTLVLLFGAVLALLVIGCANVSILLLARGTARQHELAVRVSVGAGRSRLIQQLLTESVVLSLAGAAFGVLAAYKGVEAIAAMMPYFSFPHEAAIHVNAPVLAFSATVAVLTGILFGISPAWQLSRPQLGQLIQASSGKHSGSGRERNVHRLLIAGQVALTVLLIASAGAAMKAFRVRIHTPLGFEPEHVTALVVAFPKSLAATWESRLNLNEQVRQTVSQVPGVEVASVSNTWFPPFGGFYAPVQIQSRPSLTDAQAMLGLVSPCEFETLHMQLLRGRMFDNAEVLRAAHLAVVNQTFVKQFLGDADPIGQAVKSSQLKVERPSLLGVPSGDDWLQVIGVVADARNDGLSRPVRPSVFLPYSFILPPEEDMFVRMSGDPAMTMRAIKKRIGALNPELVVGQDHSLEWWLETRGWGQERFIATLFSLFAILALALAATGLYSVVSFVVTQRTQELGIRMALGAARPSIVRLVLGSTAATIGTGLAVGIGLSVALSQVVSSWTGGSSRDPLTLVTAGLVLVGVAGIACLQPAWRAASIDPMRALRIE
jgi:predicted permease